MLGKEAIDLWLLLMNLEDNVLVEKRWQAWDFVGFLTDWYSIEVVDWISRTLSLIRDRDSIGESTISLVHEGLGWTTQIAAINRLVIRWKRFRHCCSLRQHRIHLGIVHVGISLIEFHEISARKSKPKSEKIGFHRENKKKKKKKPIMKKALEQRCRGLWYLFVMNFDWNRFICRASTAMKDGFFFFLGFLVVLRKREREKFIKREAEDDEIEKWGGGGLVFI